MAPHAGSGPATPEMRPLPDGLKVFTPRETADLFTERPQAIIEAVKVVNDAYAIGEGDLFRPGHKRTAEDGAELVEIAEHGCLMVAMGGDEVVGTVKAVILGDMIGEVGLLSVAPHMGKQGIGSALMRAAERHLVEQGCGRVELRVLAPISGGHAGKEALQRMYERVGYGKVRVIPVRPQMEATLVKECVFVVYDKGV